MNDQHFRCVLERMRLRVGWLLVPLCLGVAGCAKGPDRGLIDPAGAGREALATYDRSRDGLLDAKELESSPALKGALERFDQNGDGKLTAEEIAERLARYNSAAQTRMPMVVEVLAGEDRPVVGAMVTFSPEPFLGSAMKPATARTDDQGMASMQTEDGVADVPFGLYRILVSKEDAGRETIPARYNRQTTFGQEVAPDSRDTMITIRITGQ